MKRSLTTLALTLLIGLGLVACDDEGTGTQSQDDTTLAQDTSATPDSAQADTSPAEDTAEADSAAEDTQVAQDTSTPQDTTSTDTQVAEDTQVAQDTSTPQDTTTPQDTATTDTTPGNDTASACDYIDLGIFIVECSGELTYGRVWVDTQSSAACPEYATLLGQQADSAADVIAAAGCEDACVYTPANSVTFLYCGRRTGYIVYKDEANGCADVYEMPPWESNPGGLYDSVEAWQNENPCP